MSEFNARSDLPAPGASELVQALRRRDATEAAQSFRRVVGLSERHVRYTKVDMVKKVDKRDLKAQPGALFLGLLR